MLAVRTGPVVVVQLLILAALGTTAGLSGFGWLVGLVCGAGVLAAVMVGLARSGHTLGPADLVTLTRATLACAVAALVADAFLGRPVTVAVVTLATVALVLDAVDGRVARWTRSTSAFGARFDGEADAFLMLVLSVYVARTFGAWVLAIGLMRYAFGAAGWVLPWLRGQLPWRYWRKVVTATQGIVLTVAAADVVPEAVAYAVLAGALVMLAESFGRDVLWLWRRRGDPHEVPALVADRAAG